MKTTKKINDVIAMQKVIMKNYNNDIEKYKNLSCKHHSQNNESIQIQNNNLIVNDEKFYTDKDNNKIQRVDKLILSVDNIKKRVDTIKFFDRKKLEDLFRFELTYILRVDSIAKSKNLNAKSQIYSVLLRKICIVTNRVDLLAMCSMKKSTERFKDIMKNKHITKMISEQIKTLSVEKINAMQVKREDYKSDFSIVANEVKKMFLSELKKSDIKTKSKKQKVKKLIKSKSQKVEKITK